MKTASNRGESKRKYFRLRTDLLKRLKAEAKVLGLRQDAIVNHAIAKFMEQEGQP